MYIKRGRTPFLRQQVTTTRGRSATGVRPNLDYLSMYLWSCNQTCWQCKYTKSFSFCNIIEEKSGVISPAEHLKYYERYLPYNMANALRW